MLFRRAKEITAHLEPLRRPSLSSNDIVAAVAARRADGLPVEPRHLPICVGAATLHADTCAAMPAKCSGVPSPRVRMLLESPDPTIDYRAFISHTVASMFWDGYALILLDRPAPLTTSVRLLSAAAAQYDPAANVWRYDGETIRNELVYTVTFDGAAEGGPVAPGVSPLQQCHRPLTMYGYAYRYLIDYFAQGGNPSSILRTTHPVTGERANELVDEWITARAQRRPAVMDPTISLEVPAASGELQATLSVLDVCAAEVGRMLNVPPSLLNAPSLGSGMQYRNVADELRRFIALSLNPTWMSRLESFFRTITGDPTVQLDPAPLLELYAETGNAQQGVTNVVA